MIELYFKNIMYILYVFLGIINLICHYKCKRIRTRDPHSFHLYFLVVYYTIASSNEKLSVSAPFSHLFFFASLPIVGPCIIIEQNVFIRF